MEPGLHKVHHEVEYRHLLYLPEGYPGTALWPAILFLHGVGERGDDLEFLKAQGLPRRLAEGRGIPFLVTAPQCASGNYWSVELLASLVDEVVTSYRVDPDRLYLTGLSMGGYAAWSLAMKYPFRFAAVAPICGGGDPRRVGRLRRVPVWAFHGADDKVVRPSESRKLVDALRRCGGDARLTVYPDMGHDAWTRTYDSPELYEWFLSHRRGGMRG